LPAGPQRLLRFAQALIIKAELLLIDTVTPEVGSLGHTQLTDMLSALKHSCTIVVASNALRFIAGLADETAFMLLGRLIEFGRTDQIFSNPLRKETEDFVTGRFG
jgi:phosphate transport system ATP-binding protein